MLRILLPIYSHLARLKVFGIANLLFLSSCVTLTFHGPVTLKAPLQKPIKLFLVTNPLVKGKHKSIRNLTERISIKSIDLEIQTAYEPLQSKFLACLSKIGPKVSHTSTRYTYSDLFSPDGQPRRDKAKALLYDADKLLVVPVIEVIEKRSDVPIDSRFMCPGQYHSKIRLSLKYIDSKGRLLLDSAEIKRKNASIEQELHGLLIIKKKCGMVYNKSRVKGKFRSQFEKIQTDYLKEVLPYKKS